jgi:Cytochrome c, mono- and diheme variants
MRNVYLVTLFIVVLVVSLLGFRGTNFTKPPLDVFPEWAFPGMKYQPKYAYQGTSEFFADGRADRPIPAHTVSREPLRNDDARDAGRASDGEFLRGFPANLTLDEAFLSRGHQQYQIYCAPCHGALGDGNGITKQYGMGATPSYHDDRLRNAPEGELFNVITHGKGNMLPYSDKLAPEDRWAVILYVRALQRAQMGTAADVTDAAARTSLGIQ